MCFSVIWDVKCQHRYPNMNNKDHLVVANWAINCIFSFTILSSHNLIIHHLLLLISLPPAKHSHDNLHLLLSELLQVQFLLHFTQHKVFSDIWTICCQNQMRAGSDWQESHLEGSGRDGLWCRCQSAFFGFGSGWSLFIGSLGVAF